MKLPVSGLFLRLTNPATTSSSDWPLLALPYLTRHYFPFFLYTSYLLHMLHLPHVLGTCILKLSHKISISQVSFIPSNFVFNLLTYSSIPHSSSCRFSTFILTKVLKCLQNLCRHPLNRLLPIRFKTRKWSVWIPDPRFTLA